MVCNRVGKLILKQTQAIFRNEMNVHTGNVQESIEDVQWKNVVCSNFLYKRVVHALFLSNGFYSNSSLPCLGL